jgi:hypothetical protein
MQMNSLFESCGTLDKFDFFSNVRSLTWRGDGFSSIDSSPLRELEEMILLGRIRLANYQSLSNLKRISIRRCQTITDVSCFRDVPHLTFDQCNGITDVSSLANVSHLNLSSCGGIRELIGLNSVISLHLNKFLEMMYLQ